MTTYEKLNIELIKAGVKTEKSLTEDFDAVCTLVNTKSSAKPYQEILLSYLDKVNGNEQEMIVRALTEKGLKEVSRQLVKLFYIEKELNQGKLWAVGNALSVIDDKSTYNQILEICKNNKFGIARQMLMPTLRKINTEVSFRLLMDCLNDATVKGHALIELRKLCDPRALKTIENLQVRKGTLEEKEKKKAIAKLKM